MAITQVPTGPVDSPNAAGVIAAAEPSHGLSAGAAAGIAVAVVAAILFIGGTVAWWWFKRGRSGREKEGTGNSSSQRNSSAGMTATSLAGEESESRYYVGFEITAHSSRSWNMLMPVDPRLDPYANSIYNRGDNKSHDSVHTIRDEIDYSRKIQEPGRVLRATSPDPDLD